MSFHWLHPSLKARRSASGRGRGVWTTEAITAGTLLLIWGGRVVDRVALDRLTPLHRRRSLQVDEGLYLISDPAPEAADLVNHSCAPNAVLRGQIALEALVDLEPNAEVTFDYAMSDGSDYDVFPCACGAPCCRGVVGPEDWRRPELQARYAGHFSPYLARRIAAVSAEVLSPDRR